MKKAMKLTVTTLLVTALLVTLLCVMATEAFASTEFVQAGDFMIMGDATGYTYDGSTGCLKITAPGKYTVKNAEAVATMDWIRINADDVELTLTGVNIKTTGSPGIDVISPGVNANENVVIILAENTENVLDVSAASNQAALCNWGGALTIRGGGSLIAKGGENCAGIQSGAGTDLTIESGIITATGGANGAGIGGNSVAGSGEIHISGGTVTATGGTGAAGIGAGAQGYAEAVNITGGNVTANSTNATAIGAMGDYQLFVFTIPGTGLITGKETDDGLQYRILTGNGTITMNCGSDNSPPFGNATGFPNEIRNADGVLVTLLQFQVYGSNGEALTAIAGIEDIPLENVSLINGSSGILMLPVDFNVMKISSVTQGDVVYPAFRFGEDDIAFANVEENPVLNAADGPISLTTVLGADAYQQGDKTALYTGILTVNGTVTGESINYTGSIERRLISINGEVAWREQDPTVCLAVEGDHPHMLASVYEAFEIMRYCGVKTTLTLLQEVAVDVSLELYGGEHVLDLNGYQLTITTGGSNGIYLADGAKLTVRDSAAQKTGKLYGDTTHWFGYLLRGTTLVIESGTVESANAGILDTGRLEILGGKLQSAPGKTTVNTAEILFTGGTVIGSILAKKSLLDIVQEGYAIKNGEDFADMSGSSVSGTLTVARAPITAGGLSDATVFYGNPTNASFTVSVNGAAAGDVLSYQWYRGASMISNATAATLVIPSDWGVGEYTVSCVVTWTSGEQTYITESETVSVKVKELVLEADDLEWVLPHEGAIYKTYDGTTSYDGNAFVCVKAGVINESSYILTGSFVFKSADVIENNELIFTAQNLVVGDNYVVPVGLEVRHPATVLPNMNFSAFLVDYTYSKTYDGTPIALPASAQLQTSNNAALSSLTFEWVGENGKTVSDPFMVGRYNLYVTVPDNANGLGGTTFLGEVWINTAHGYLPGGDYYSLAEDADAFVERYITENLSLAEGDVVASFRYGTNHVVDILIKRGDVDVTHCYTINGYDPPTFHFLTFNGHAYECDACLGMVHEDLNAPDAEIAFLTGASTGWFTMMELDETATNKFDFVFAFLKVEWLDITERVIGDLYGTAVAEYLWYDGVLSQYQLADLEGWQPLTEGTVLAQKQVGYLYARVIDAAGNATYLWSGSPVIIDPDAIRITGAQDEGDYYSTVVLKISSPYKISEILMNDKTIYLSENGEGVTEYTLVLEGDRNVVYHVSVCVSRVMKNFCVYMNEIESLGHWMRGVSVDNVLTRDEIDLKETRAQAVAAQLDTATEAERAKLAEIVAQCDTLLARVAELKAPATTPDAGNTGNGTNNDAGLNTSPTPDVVEEGGLPAGAIVAIVIGSVLVVAVGGFAIFWFVIKKKGWSDLVGGSKK